MATTKAGKLFLVAGSSGAGKSAIASAVAGKIPGFKLVRKGTTRDVRADDVDVFHDTSLKDLRGNKTRAAYVGAQNARYGVDIDAIRTILVGGENAVLVCVDNGVTEYLREEFPGRVVVVFVHRDLSTTMMKTIVERGGADRLGQRVGMYVQLATGTYRPDYELLNVGTVDQAVEQFRRIATAAAPLHPGRRQNTKGVLHIVVAPTGSLKDAVDVGAQSLPGWEAAFVPKDVKVVPPGSNNTNSPAGWLGYSFFGKLYLVDPSVVMKQLKQYRVAFITISNIDIARSLKAMIEQHGFAAELHYLHQTSEEIRQSVRDFPKDQWKPRLKHARELLRQYDEELILEAHPILAVNGERDVVSWVQKCIRERPRGLKERLVRWWQAR